MVKTMSLNNLIIPFTICDTAIKGRIIKLDTELDKILSQHNYPAPIERILSELLMVASIIGSQFKEEITLSVQFQSNDSSVKYIIADYQSPNQIRGYAQFNNLLPALESYQDILNKGFLSVTIDRKLYNNQRYQGIVETTNMTIAQAVEKYFYQSEQIKTSLKLAVGNIIVPGGKEISCAGGIMIQKLPGDDEPWNDAQAYFITIRDDELLDPSLSLEDLLYSLYHEVGVTIYDYVPIINKCRCSKQKAEQVLLSIGNKDALSLLVDDKLEVNCQFCNESQVFVEKDIKKIFSKRKI
jgi:molecular chaperone Hsp33